ncbi:hypothetical protein BN439_3423 [Erwinia amylovora Ea644]|nr:hypothetical protein [Erwinia amylovora]CCP04449.1 hypothetical protein BN439_3423 [Erwinia amylovora Ea644]CCP08516.1 hypothetical protein BN440_3521 [Erwinia amylovora MR1]
MSHPLDLHQSDFNINHFSGLNQTTLAGYATGYAAAGQRMR